MRTTIARLPVDGRPALVAVSLAAACSSVPAAAPTPQQLATDIAGLRARLAQVEAQQRATTPPAPPPRANSPVTDPALAGLQAKVRALEQDLAALRQVLQLNGSAVVLRAPGTLSIESGGTLSIRSSADTTLQAASTLRLRSSAVLDMEGGSRAELKSAGVTAVRGSPVQLNQGAKPAAYKGGRTAGGPVAQTITDGSATVLLP